MPEFIRIPRLSTTEWLLLVVATFRFLTIDLVGRLQLSEVLLISAAGLFVVFGQSIRIDRTGRTILVLAFIWLAAQMATDLYVGSELRDLLRGWSNILFLILGIFALSIFDAGHGRHLKVFASGWGLGSLVQLLVSPSIYQQSAPVKFGFSPAVMYLALVLLSSLQLQRKHQIVLGLLALIVWCLATSMRSNALAIMGTLCIVLISPYFKNWSTKSALNKMIQFSSIVSVVLVAGIILLQIYSATVEGGGLGAKAREKHETQTTTDFGFFFAARSEILVSTLAVIDSPIVGHGSWYKDAHLASLFMDIRNAMGLGVQEVESDPDFIHTHSFLMGAWVHSGIVGALFWAIVGICCVRVIIVGMTLPGHTDVLTTTILLMLVWSIGFSALNGESRFLAEFSLCVLIFRMAEVREERRRRIVSP